MIIDSRQFSSAEPPRADLCIIGGGAAGISLAREFSGTGRQVILVESGGMRFNARTQQLYEGQTEGIDYPLTETRVRVLGGSTHAWWGNCRPLDDFDFKKRDWIPHSGWPIGRRDLDPYYRRAQEVTLLGDFDLYDNPEKAAREAAGQPLEFDNPRLVTRGLQRARELVFSDIYGEELEKSENLRVFLHANVLEIVPGSNGKRIERLKIGTLDGKRFDIVPQTVVLATGGMENARLLLASNSVMKQGLGNERDVVGRYFMEHPVLHPAFVPESPWSFFEFYNFNSRSAVNGTETWHMLAPSEETMEKQKLVNVGVQFEAGVSQAVQSLEALKEYVIEREGDIDLWKHVGEVLKDFYGVARYAYDKKVKKLERHEMDQKLLFLPLLLEQVPDAENRVTLSDEKDALGMPRLKLSYRLTDDDKENYRRIQQVLAEEFGKAGYGRLRAVDPDADSPLAMNFWAHHMGSTRMSDDPSRGVVDRDLKVHGIDNLYIASSSVFPTSGFAPPTLTIVALTLRLADHLKARAAA